MPHGIRINSPLKPVFEKVEKPAKRVVTQGSPYTPTPSRDWVYKEMRRRGTTHFGRGIVPPKPKQI